VLPDSWKVSPQQTDPMSWFTRPLVPLMFAGMLLAYGVAVTFVTWPQLNEPWIELVAIALLFSACIVVQLWTQPMRPRFTTRHAIVPLAMAIGAVALSTFSMRESTVLVQHWWVPIGAGMLLAALAPYSSVRQLIVYSSVLVVATSAGAWFAFMLPSSLWPPLSAMVIAASAVVIASVATSTFSLVIVSTTQKLLANAEPKEVEALETVSVEVARQVERRTLARLGTRVAPFLQGIADSGVVEESDRALAGQLARRLRSDLVNQANRSWLDSLALYGSMYVVDPDHRADSMNTVQRAALRGLLLAVMKNPTTNGSLFIELRGQVDGSTAVALSIDVDLPEGRRTMMLAPYYLTPQTAVQDLTWDPSRELLKFQFPAQQD